jgi:hypothetical protein
VNVAKVIRRRFRIGVTGAEIAGDVNAVIASNIGGSGQRTVVSSTQTATASEGRTQGDPRERGGDDGSRGADA